MSVFSLTEINTCSQYDADSTFFCIPTGTENCCTSDGGSLWSEEYADLSTLLFATSDYTAPSTTSMTTDSTIGVTATMSIESALQTPSLLETHPLLSTSGIMADSSQGPETLASDINAVDVEVPPSSTALSTGAKAGIGVGGTVAVLLILGLGTAASIFYRRSKQIRTQNNEGISMEHSVAGYFAADHVIPEMDATVSQRPAELEEIALPEQPSSDLSRWSIENQKPTGYAKGKVHELQA